MDPHWESDLETLLDLMEDPPPTGSDADRCIDTLLERVLRNWRDAPAEPRDNMRTRIELLSKRIEAFEARRAADHPEDRVAEERSRTGFLFPF